jgi:presenilin 1
MILSSLAVVYVNTPETRAAGEASISQVYTVYGSASESESNASSFGKALANALVIVAAVCAVTFVLVLLYKWRCMKCLLSYMVIASAMLLGYLAGTMFNVAIQTYDLMIDKLSFYASIYNFCIVGCLSIFFSKGIPMSVTQGYLIATSVIVAWQLSYFDSWTAWLLLIMLALYDLFAVLSPCGPLKALVKLMQRDDAPEMPGLLYEANVQARRPDRQPRERATESTTHVTNTEQAQSEAVVQNSFGGPIEEANENNVETQFVAAHSSQQASDGGETDMVQTLGRAIVEAETSIALAVQALTCLATTVNAVVDNMEEEEATPQRRQETRSLTNSRSVAVVEAPTALIPLALAKRYKLPTVDDLWPRWMPNEDGTPTDTTFSAEELRSLVQVRFPVDGGRIHVRPSSRPNEEPRYEVIDREGNLRRVVFLNARGELFQEVQNENGQQGATKDRNNIKLGLGDFIFYSILVSKAALYSYTAFAACTLVILIGLLGTLLLLSAYGKALPALPISIFLGVIFYLLTRYLMQPWIQTIFIEQSYV